MLPLHFSTMFYTCNGNFLRLYRMFYKYDDQGRFSFNTTNKAALWPTFKVLRTWWTISYHSLPGISLTCELPCLPWIVTTHGELISCTILPALIWTFKVWTSQCCRNNIFYFASSSLTIWGFIQTECSLLIITISQYHVFVARKIIDREWKALRWLSTNSYL